MQRALVCGASGLVGIALGWVWAQRALGASLECELAAAARVKLGSKAAKRLFQLQPGVLFVNHGSVRHGRTSKTHQGVGSTVQCRGTWLGDSFSSRKRYQCRKPTPRSSSVGGEAPRQVVPLRHRESGGAGCLMELPRNSHLSQFDRCEQALRQVASFVEAPARDLVFVTNATSGVQSVVHSLHKKLEKGDALLCMDIAYNACVNIIEVICHWWPPRSPLGIAGVRRCARL